MLICRIWLFFWYRIICRRCLPPAVLPHPDQCDLDLVNRLIPHHRQARNRHRLNLLHQGLLWFLDPRELGGGKIWDWRQWKESALAS